MATPSEYEQKSIFSCIFTLVFGMDFFWLIPVDTEEPSLLTAQLIQLRLTLLLHQNLFNSS